MNVIPIAKFKTVNMPEVSNRFGENGNCAMGVTAKCLGIFALCIERA